MLTEKQILTAYDLKKQGKTYREIANAVGLDGKTQHSQVVTALKYFIVGYQAAMRKTESLSQGKRSLWVERLLGFCACSVFYLAITIVATLLGMGD